MRSNRPASLAIMVVFFLIGSASADVIPSPSPLSGPPLDLVGPSARGEDPLALSNAIGGLNPDRSPLLRHAEANGLAGSSIDAQPALIAAPVPLPRPELTNGMQLDASSRPMIREASVRDRKDTLEPLSGHNIRIPEPASVTLVAAGLIGLAARRHLRRNNHVKAVAEIELE